MGLFNAERRTRIHLLALGLLWLVGFGTSASAAVPGCGGAAPYTPYTSSDPTYTIPLVSRRNPAVDVTVIVLHGKNGWPHSSYRRVLYDELAAAGYNVIAPQLTWSYLWDGTHCQGLNYVDELVDAERAAGRRVVLMGHSFGGTHALIYASKAGAKLEAVVPIAPGHMLPLAKTVIRETQPSVDKALSLVAKGKGDIVTDFNTYNGGALQAIDTTPNIFLSFHALDQFTDVTVALPQVSVPVFWVAGSTDSLTGFYDRSGVYGMLPATPDNQYVVLNGDHTSVVEITAPAFDDWFRGWNKVNVKKEKRPPSDIGVNYLLLL